MDLKNFCIIVLGKVMGVKDEIRAISELDVNFVEHKNIVIATFSTVATVGELKEFFTSNKRGFFLFELGKNNYAVDVGSVSVYNTLFGKFEETDKNNLNSEMTTRDFLMRIHSEILNTNYEKFKISGGTDIEDAKIIDVSSMTNEEKQRLINEIIDKGYQNFTTRDKELLSKLTKDDEN